MVFSSPVFLFLFFPVFYFIYLAIGRKHSNAVLLVGSVLFYFYGAGAASLRQFSL